MNNNNNISIFNNDNFGELRIIMQDGEPWLVAKDVCDALGLENSRDALASLDADEKITVANPNGNPRAGIPHQFSAVNEAGFYSLIFRSRKPEAKTFKRWVTHEVLPAIRKDGGYIKVDKGDTDELIMAKAVLIGDATIKRLKAELQEAAPKIALHDRYLDCGSNLDCNAFSKSLQDGGIYITPNKLTALLRMKKILCSKRGLHWNRPYQKYVEKGWLTIKPMHPSMVDKYKCTPMITPLGQAELFKLIPVWLEEIEQVISN